jgi:hypothetical protein
MKRTNRLQSTSASKVTVAAKPQGIEAKIAKATEAGLWVFASNVYPDDKKAGSVKGEGAKRGSTMLVNEHGSFRISKKNAKGEEVSKVFFIGNATAFSVIDPCSGQWLEPPAVSGEYGKRTPDAEAIPDGFLASHYSQIEWFLEEEILKGHEEQAAGDSTRLDRVRKLLETGLTVDGEPLGLGWYADRPELIRMEQENEETVRVMNRLLSLLVNFQYSWDFPTVTPEELAEIREDLVDAETNARVVFTAKVVFPLNNWRPRVIVQEVLSWEEAHVSLPVANAMVVTPQANAQMRAELRARFTPELLSQSRQAFIGEAVMKALEGGGTAATRNAQLFSARLKDAAAPSPAPSTDKTPLNVQEQVTTIPADAVAVNISDLFDDGNI